MFKKTTYSDLEVQEIMETLFLEKKKVKELQLKLSNCQTNSIVPASSEELAKQRAEIQMLLVRLEEGKLREQQCESKRLQVESEIRHLKNNAESVFGDQAKLKSEYHTLLNQSESDKKRAEEEICKLKEELQNYQTYTSYGEEPKLKAEYQSLLNQSESDKKLAEEEICKLKEELQNYQTYTSYGEESKLKAEYQSLLNQSESDKKLAEEETHRLKEQLHQFLSENSTQDKQKEAQLERVVQFMRARVEETQVENHHLVQKIASFEEKEKTFNAEIEETKKTADRLNLEKEELKEEEQALKAQMEQLHSEIFKMQNLVHGEKENQEALINAQKEIDLLKQMMMKALQENKEERLKEESLYQAQILTLREEHAKEKADRETISVQLNEQTELAEERQTSLALLETLKIELSLEVEQQKRAYHELAQFAEEMKSKIVKSDEEKVAALATLMKKEELIHNLSSQVANLSRSNEKMEDLTRQAEIDKQENEARLRAAQAHLAKKMREMALLTEQYEELKLRHEDLEKTLESFKGKLIEMKAQLDAEAQQKQSFQKQYQEGLKSIEMQSAKWEEKYFQIHEKWQDTEARNRELKRLEERFGKVQHLFGNLGNLLGSPMTMETPEVVETPVAKKFAEEHSVQTSLFEAVPTGRYKESLF